MGTRRKSREFALQALYFLEWERSNPPAIPQVQDIETGTELRLRSFCSNFQVPQTHLSFFLMLVRGVTYLRPEIDAIIERFSSHWKVHRMSSVDRNILRMAVFEICCRPEIPHTVSINEAIDLGKKFGTEESGAFINGILDSLRIAIEKEPISWITVSEEIRQRIENPDLKPVDELMHESGAAAFHPIRSPVSDRDADDDEHNHTETKPRRRRIVQNPKNFSRAVTTPER
jgi:N utilization substance protein B